MRDARWPLAAAQPLPRHRRRRSAALLSAAALLATALALGRSLPALAPLGRGVEDEATAAGAPFSVVVEALDQVDASLRPLQEQVQAGQVVPKFGERAQAIVAGLADHLDTAAPEIERIIDGQLEVLFLRQLVALRRQLAGKFETASLPLEAVSQADEKFVAQAQELVRPGSSWSFEHERYVLRAALEGVFRKDMALVEEKARSARVQRTTVEVINKLQSQMEALQQKVQNMRAGSPWLLSASYRIPRTPFQLIGRYQQGHGSMELNLSPDKDPANAEAGFVQGLAGPANIGVSANLGV